MNEFMAFSRLGSNLAELPVREIRSARILDVRRVTSRTPSWNWLMLSVYSMMSLGRQPKLLWFSSLSMGSITASIKAIPGTGYFFCGVVPCSATACSPLSLPLSCPATEASDDSACEVPASVSGTCTCKSAATCAASGSWDFAAACISTPVATWWVSSTDAVSDSCVESGTCADSTSWAVSDACMFSRACGVAKCWASRCCLS